MAHDIYRGGPTIYRGMASRHNVGYPRHNRPGDHAVQCGDVLESNAMKRVVRAPSFAPVEDVYDELQTASTDLEENVTERKK